MLLMTSGEEIDVIARDSTISEYFALETIGKIASARAGTGQIN
jgi:hypothetical protein